MKRPGYQLAASKADGTVCFTYDAAEGGHGQLHVDERHILTEAIQQDTGVHAFKVRHWRGKGSLDEDIV
jgi:hypothetical protein